MPDQILLPAGEWRLWEQFALRGPGFPAAGVLRLAPDGLAAAADKFGPDEPRRGPGWDAFLAQFADASVATARELQDIAATPSFREALAWQNRAVLRTGIAPFLAWTPTARGRTSMPRQREELVAHYWQRFCVKNDTIGFFGPVGWGTLDPGRDGVAVDPGSGLIASSEVYFASWAIDALARAVEGGVRAGLPPRRVPFVRVADGAVTVPGRPAQPVDRRTEVLLRACDGTRGAADLAAQLTAAGHPATQDEVAASVDELVRRRWLVQRLEVPTGPDPERHLRATLERLAATPERQDALDRLATLVAARDRVRAAQGDADAVDAAVGELEAVFTELTDASGQREKGARTAPCRGLVYSDARRSATVAVGSGVLDRLAPLELCLAGARWMTDRVAERVGARIRSAHDELAAGGAAVDLGALWMRCLPAPHARTTADVEEVATELRTSWARILDLPADPRPDLHRVQRSGAELAGRVAAEFGAPGRGWDLARYVSPDVIVLADDPAAVERGDVDIVLGELHVAMNTVGASLFVMQHPDAASLLAETTTDFPAGRIMPVLHKEKPPRWSARSRPALVRPEDHFVALVDHTVDPHRPRTWLSADVLVEPRPGRDATGLAAVLPDGSEFGLLDVFGHALTNAVMDRFGVHVPGWHSPRITIDRVVVARETWRFTAADLTFAGGKDEAGRFVEARGWRERHELPRFVFVVSPTEPRPFYVDFDSPVYLSILAKAVRRLAREDPAGVLTVSEMLPDPTQAWLPDDRGEHYTSEFRFVAVDQRPGGTS